MVRSEDRHLPEAPGDRVDHVRDHVPVDGVAGVGGGGGVEPQLLDRHDGLVERLVLLNGSAGTRVHLPQEGLEGLELAGQRAGDLDWS